MKKSVLYITYDGLADPLGQSQILPYLKLISQHPRKTYVLSFEKRARLQKYRESIEADLKSFSIEWKPLAFSSELGTLGKIIDLLKMNIVAFILAIQFKIRVIHARGHISALAGLIHKIVLRSKILFDVRGLWVDERVDKGLWLLNKRIDYVQYRIFKIVERILFKHADGIVILSHLAVDIVERLGASDKSKIIVIPCCTDFDYFQPATAVQRVDARKRLCIPPDSLVLGYLGSYGRMYVPELFLGYIRRALTYDKFIWIVIFTSDIKDFTSLINNGLNMEMRKKIIIMEVSRSALPELLAAVDVMLCFILPTFARLASSPTKISESLAMGIPIITNKGVGDTSKILVDLSAGILVDLYDRKEVFGTISKLRSLTSFSSMELSNRARQIYGLEVADHRYKLAYENLE